MKDRDVITTNSLANTTLGWFSNRTGASVDNGERKSNNTGANWQRKSRLVLSTRFPVINWHSHSVAKSAHEKVGFAWAVMSQSFAVRALFTQSLAVGGGTSRKIGQGSAAHLLKPLPYFRPKSEIFATLFQTCSINLSSVSHTSSPWGEIFSCSESTCVLTFKTWEEADAHTDAGKHAGVSGLDGESMYDAARKNAKL